MLGLCLSKPSWYERRDDTIGRAMNGCGDDVFLDLPVLNNMAGTGSPRSLLVEISKKIFDIRRRFLTARCLTNLEKA